MNQSLLERLQLRGAASLGDAELLSLLIEEGAEGSLERAEALLAACGGSLSRLGKADLARLRMTAGVGLKRAVKVLAVAELGRRMVCSEAEQEIRQITSSEDVDRLFRPRMADLQHEECWALFLTTSNRIIEQMRISQGGLQYTVVDQRLLIKRALELLASQLILVHNHPSGSADPSDADKLLTSRVKEAAALFDIALIDHLILAREERFSFRANGLL